LHRARGVILSTYDLLITYKIRLVIRFAFYNHQLTLLRSTRRYSSLQRTIHLALIYPQGDRQCSAVTAFVLTLLSDANSISRESTQQNSEEEAMRRLAMFVFLAVFAAGARAQLYSNSARIVQIRAERLSHTLRWRCATQHWCALDATSDDRGEFRFIDVPSAYELKGNCAGFQAARLIELCRRAPARRRSAEGWQAAATVTTLPRRHCWRTESASAGRWSMSAKSPSCPERTRILAVVELTAGVVPVQRNWPRLHTARGSFDVNGCAALQYFLLDGMDNNSMAPRTGILSNQVVSYRGRGC